MSEDTWDLRADICVRTLERERKRNGEGEGVPHLRLLQVFVAAAAAIVSEDLLFPEIDYEACLEEKR